MILKVQRSIYPADGPMLVYNEDRTVLATVMSTDDILKLFGESYKIYVDGQLRDDGKLVIDRVVAEEEVGW